MLLKGPVKFVFTCQERSGAEVKCKRRTASFFWPWSCLRSLQMKDER